MPTRVSRGPPAPRLFKGLLHSAIRELREGRETQARDTILFLGARQQSFPSLLIEDPILAPVDKLIWMVIWQRGAAGGTRARFPTYRELAASAHIRSDTTIARALAILRATRWLSLCARVRDSHGKFRGNVYAVHDEPLALSDTLQLDPSFLDFLDAAKHHSHPRVSQVVSGVLASLDADIDAGHDVMAPPDLIARRLEAQHAIAEPGTYRYFSFTPSVLSELANGCEPRLQQLETVSPLQDLEWGCSSSININKTPTTEDLTSAPAREAALIFPPGLSTNQRLLAVRYLDRLPMADRQSILDELEGRLRAARLGAKPLYDPLRYLHRLCEAFVRGHFVVNLGGAVEAERRRREQREPPDTRNAPSSATPKLDLPIAEKKAGNNPVESIRQQFNLPSTLKTRA